MVQTVHKAYLEAMGIPVWELRNRPAEELKAQTVQLGPGSGQVLLLAPTIDDSAIKLSSDIARALRAEPVWGWPADEDSAAGLEESVAERLFTHIVVFGGDAELAIFGGPAPELIGSAVVVTAPGLDELEQTPAERRKLWALLCQHRIAGTRKPPGND